MVISVFDKPYIWTRRTYSLSLLLISLLSCCSQASATDLGECRTTPDQPVPKCGTPHSLTRQVQRPRMKIYVSEGGGQAAIYNKLSCLASKASRKWSQACPAIEGVARIPEIEVVRGDRPTENQADLEIKYSTAVIGHAQWDPDRNSIGFNDTKSWNCDPGTPSPTAEEQLFIDIATHEIGHAMGLCHDSCGGQAGPSIMSRIPREGTSYGIHPEHCAAIKKTNYCRDGQCSPSSVNACDDSPTGPCRFYDGFPRFMDLCRSMALPIACGQTIPPSSELCYHITAGRIGRRTTTQVLYDPATGTTYESTEVEVVDETHSYIHCVPIGWPSVGESGPGAVGGDLEGDGPIFFVRTRYVGPMSGVIPVSGVLRDDLFGLGQLAFWVDGQPSQLQGLQTGLYDPYTCSEDPASNCDAWSGWQGFFDTSGIPNGFHTLTVAGANFRPGDPIPNMDAVSFFVDHDQGCSETTPPMVRLTSPLAHATVSGRVVVSASASDASGIEKVQFYVDGVRRRADLSAPWTFSWDTAVFSDGAHTLGVRSVDLCGNAAWGANVPVTVVNGQPVTLTFTPTDDAWVNQDEPDRAFGIYNFLRVRTHLGGHGRFSFLKFNVTGLGGPITSAILRLRSQDQPISRFGVYRITGNSWNEATVTWNTALLTHDWFGGEQSPWAAGTWRDFDVTGALSGTGGITFGLATGQNSGLLDIWSKESGIYVPVLEVTFVPGI